MNDWLHLEDVVFDDVPRVYRNISSPMFSIGIRRFHVRINPARRPRDSEQTFLAVHLRQEEQGEGAAPFEGTVMLRLPLGGAMYYVYRTKESWWNNQNRSHGTYRYILTSKLFDGTIPLENGGLRVAVSVKFSDELFPRVTTFRVPGGKQIVYGAVHGEWKVMGNPRMIRPLNTVFVNDDIKSKVLNDLRAFLASEHSYPPHRKAYLVFGPEGCGKTSFVSGIAGEIGYDVGLISLNAHGLDDVMLMMLVNTMPENCIVLLEDVDRAVKSRNENCGGRSMAVTCTSFLNIIDGVASPEGKIIFLTARCLKDMDPALVRPGRVDMKVLVDYPNDDQLYQIFARFYSETSEEMKRDFVAKIRELGSNLSMAAIQGLCMCHKQDAQAAIDEIQTYFKE